jgi:hypothetical protein
VLNFLDDMGSTRRGVDGPAWAQAFDHPIAGRILGRLGGNGINCRFLAYDTLQSGAADRYFGAPLLGP